MSISKEQIYQHCVQRAKDSVEQYSLAVKDTQASANEETKNTSGDKHDTSRAMIQLEVEQLSKQLEAAEKILAAIRIIDPKKKSSVVQTGSIVITDKGNYYISVGLGTIKIDGETWYAISPGSPIAQVLIGTKKDDKISFNQQEYLILEVI